MNKEEQMVIMHCLMEAYEHHLSPEDAQEECDFLLASLHSSEKQNI